MGLQPIYPEAHSSTIKGKTAATNKVLLLYPTLSCITQTHLTWASKYMQDTLPGLWAFEVFEIRQDNTTENETWNLQEPIKYIVACWSKSVSC